MVGTVIVNGDEVVRPSQLIASVGRTSSRPIASLGVAVEKEYLLHSIPRRVAAAAIVGVVMVTVAGRSAPGAADPVHVVVPNEIRWSAVPGYPPGYARAMLEGAADKAVPFTYRVRLPAGFKFQPHTHSGDEHVTVLQGAWAIGVGETFDSSRLRVVPAGAFVVIPAGTPHFVSTEGDTIIQVHGIGPIAVQFVGRASAPPR